MDWFIWNDDLNLIFLKSTHRIGELLESLKSMPQNECYTEKDADNENSDPDDSKLVVIKDTQKLVEGEAEEGPSSRTPPDGGDAESIASGESLMAFQLDQVAISSPDKEQVLVKG